MAAIVVVPPGEITREPCLAKRTSLAQGTANLALVCSASGRESCPEFQPAGRRYFWCHSPFDRFGIRAYGFGLFSRNLSFEDYGSMFHGDDERVDVESLVLSTALWSARTAWSSRDIRLRYRQGSRFSKLAALRAMPPLRPRLSSASQ